MPSQRRPKGEGSITQLPSGKYRIRLEGIAVDGKRKWLSATADTITQARKKLKELIQQKENSVSIVQLKEDTITYQGELYKQHLRALQRSGSTIVQSERVVNALKACLHNKSLINITSKDIDKLILMWHERGLKQHTINGYVGVLRGFFQWLTNNDVIKRSPVIYKAKARKNRAKQNLVVLSAAEHNQIKEYFYTFWLRKEKVRGKNLIYRMYALYCLAYETGMRTGEIVALKWEDINIPKCCVTVSRTLTTTEDSTHIIGDTTKSDAGHRTIIISEKTSAILAELKEFSNEEFVFYNYRRHGNFLTSALLWCFRRALTELGIDRGLTFHDIRHTNASNMIYKNVPIAVITERLGHSSIAITYSTYGHIIQECQEAKIAVIEA